jgi:prolyl oligopeptidase
MNLVYNVRAIIIFLLAVVVVSSYQCKPKESEKPVVVFDTIPVAYPTTLLDSTVFDTYFGRKVADPYRWLEQDTTAKVVEWTNKQNELAEAYLSKIPFRNKLSKRMGELLNFEKLEAPYETNGKFYFFKNDGLQDQSVLYSMDRPNAQPIEVLDPNLFSKDGSLSIEEYAFSKDGKYFAYALSTNGSDARKIKVRDLLTKTDLADEVESIYSEITWHGNGFFYSKFKPAPSNALGIKDLSTIYYHELGTKQSQDKEYYSDPSNPQRFNFAYSTLDEAFTVLFCMDISSGNGLLVKKGDEPKFKPIMPSVDNYCSVAFNKGDSLYLLTNIGATRKQIFVADYNHPEQSNWVPFIPENPTDVLNDAYLLGDKVLTHYLHNAYSVLRLFDLNGKLVKEVALPEIGSVGQIRPTEDSRTVYFTFKSFLRPTSVYTLDMSTYEVKLFDEPVISFNPDEYTTEQAWATSKDGTKIPLFISYKKGTKLNGTNPTMMYGYGGFAYGISPTFVPSKAALLEKGGIFVVANIRGGSEFGDDWHKSAILNNKHKCFEDFIAAAEYLIEKKYTSPARLAIEGASNGGLLIAAVMNMRPDLFSACLVQEGVLDMLRYHKFGIGYAWAGEYGRSEDSKESFENLLSYSPLHNIMEKPYPATFVLTADNDQRVAPGHSFKYAATLQQKQQGRQPILIVTQKNIGHGSEKPRTIRVAESTDNLAFVLYQMKFNYE